MQSYAFCTPSILACPEKRKYSSVISYFVLLQGEHNLACKDKKETFWQQIWRSLLLLLASYKLMLILKLLLFLGHTHMHTHSKENYQGQGTRELATES